MSELDRENATDSGAIQSEESSRRFSLSEIQSATNNFDDASVIGIGGFGKVYKGSIDNGGGATIVAVKRLNVESKQGAEEFWMEVKLLSKLRHNHLVALIGYCNDFSEMILVYEYIARGTLANHLYKTSSEESGDNIFHLSWEQRMHICIGAARGLDYLHAGTDQSFIHRDVKTTNILLDNNSVAKISDFGLSKGITSHSTTHVSTEVKGTFGYLDPDYFYTRRLTKKSDVFAFGVVLLEVLCGRPPVDRKLEEEQISLVLWAEQCIKKGKVYRIIDPSLSGQILPRCLKCFVELATNCLNKTPKERPKMAEVVGGLELALVAQQKGRTEGIIKKVFHGIGFLPKGMNRWLGETKDDNSSPSGQVTENLPKGVDHPPRERKADSSSAGPSEDSRQESQSHSVTQLPYHFSLSEIRAATKDFSEGLLIRGSRKVYRGSVFLDGRILEVAIKIFKEVKLEEIMLQSCLHHPNVATLIGFCFEGHELILVFEYMASGSLRDLLNGSPRNPLLTWEMRLQICIDVAGGLQYLQTDAEHEIIKDNINPSNIFLNKKWVAKVGYNFPKMIPTSNRTDSVPKCYDISGIFDSEYLACGKTTTYSFGVLLLEVLSSKKAINLLLEVVPTFQKLTLFDLFTKILDIEAIDYVIDPSLIRKTAPESLKEIVNLALSCMSEQKIKQCSMNYAVERLSVLQQQHESWLTHSKIDGPDFRGFSYAEVSFGVEELACAHGLHYTCIEGRWGLILSIY